MTIARKAFSLPASRQAAQGWKAAPASLLAALGMLSAAGLSEVAADDSKAWRAGEHNHRVRFSVAAKSGPELLVRLPLTDAAARTLSVAAYSPTGEALGWAPVHTNRETAFIRLAVGDKADPTGPYAVYYGGPDAPGSGAALPPCPEPVAIRFHALPGKGAPTTWERMDHLRRKVSAPANAWRQGKLFPLEGPTADDQEALKREGAFIDARRTHLLCPRDGRYRFRMEAYYAAFLLIDGELAVATPGPPAAMREATGTNILLSAGPHRLDLLTVHSLQRQPSVDWQLAGTTNFVPLGNDALLPADAVMHTPLDLAHRTLSPFFEPKVTRSYIYYGLPQVFTDVRFRNHTRNYLKQRVTHRWQFGDGEHATDPSPAHVFTSPGPHVVTLTSTDALGFERSYSRRLEFEELVPKQFRASFSLVSLPAVAYAHDIVEPMIHAVGYAPKDNRFTLTWEIVTRNGDLSRRTRELTVREDVQVVPLGRLHAGSLESLRWEATVHGSTFAGGTVGAVDNIAANERLTARGDALYAASGDRVVLVANHLRRGLAAPRTTSLANGRVVWIDDTLSLSGDAFRGQRLVAVDRLAERLRDMTDDLRTPRVDVAKPPAWREQPAIYGPLQILAQAPGLAGEGADIVVLSLGLRDLLARVDPGTFERHAAALTDLLLREGRGLPLWVTPPPYPWAPERARPYAVALMNVADARGLPVADLYTAFAGDDDDGEPLFTLDARDGGSVSLSLRGQQLAGDVVANALDKYRAN